MVTLKKRSRRQERRSDDHHSRHSLGGIGKRSARPGLVVARMPASKERVIHRYSGVPVNRLLYQAKAQMRTN